MDNKQIEEIIKKECIKGLDNLDLFSYLLDLKDNEDVFSNLLAYVNKVQRLRSITYHELISILNVSKKKIFKLMCMIELSNRIYQKELDFRTSLFDSDDVYELIRNEMEYLEQENLVVISIDIKGKILKKETIYIGTTTSIPVSVKEIFRTPLRLGAFGFVMIHNHPTGDAKPSVADDKLTKKIMDASELMSIELIDHIIVGKSEFYSYKNKKLFKI